MIISSIRMFSYQDVTNVGKRPAIAAAAAMAGLTRWVRPGPLAAFEIAVRRRGATLARFQPVGVHGGQTHRSIPVRAIRNRRRRRPCPDLRLRLALDQAEPGTASASLTLAATWRPLTTGRLAQILDAEFARTDENLVDGGCLDRRIGVESHVRRARSMPALDRIGVWLDRARRRRWPRPFPAKYPRSPGAGCRRRRG